MPDDYLENTNAFSVNATFNDIYLENLLGTDWLILNGSPASYKPHSSKAS